MDGLLVINKPINCSSMDIIRKVRRLTGIKKVGHAGTLDPLASGVLLVCLGKSTKQISQFMDLEKEYVTKIDLSAFSNTDDAEGELIFQTIEHIPHLSEIEQIINKFKGNIWQTPPKYSAIKINGERAYKKAKQGEEFELKPRMIEIFDLNIIAYKWPILELQVKCSKGTYIRSLARDIGKELKTGGYIIELKRTSIGNYNLQNAKDVYQIITLNEQDLIKLQL